MKSLMNRDFSNSSLSIRSLGPRELPQKIWTFFKTENISKSFLPINIFKSPRELSKNFWDGYVD